MARSLFWIEPSEVGALLDRIADPPPPAVGAGAAKASRKPLPRSRGQSNPQALVRVGENLEERLGALLDWLPSVIDHHGAFIADHQGLALVERDTTPEMIAAAAAMVDQWQGIRSDFALAGDGGMTIDLGEEGALYVVPARARWGAVCVGLVSNETLDRAGRAMIAEALERSVAEDEGESS